MNTYLRYHYEVWYTLYMQFTYSSNHLNEIVANSHFTNEKLKLREVKKFSSKLHTIKCISIWGRPVWLRPYWSHLVEMTNWVLSLPPYFSLPSVYQLILFHLLLQTHIEYLLCTKFWLIGFHMLLKCSHCIKPQSYNEPKTLSK